MTLRHIPAALLLALGCVQAGCLPFEPTDPRVGDYLGSFPGGGRSPLIIRFDVLPSGQVRFATGLESYVEGGSRLAQLSGGSREFHFESQRSSQGKTAWYHVDAKLLPGDQVIEGTMTYWTQLDGNGRVDGPPNTPFRVRRTQRSPGYVQTTPGDFSCAPGISYAPPGTGFNPPEDGGIPQPSCFTGDLTARTIMPLGTAQYQIHAKTAATSSARSLAIFSACDGRELACKYVDSADAGYAPERHAVKIDLTQFEEVLVVSEGEYIGLVVYACNLESVSQCW